MTDQDPNQQETSIDQDNSSTTDSASETRIEMSANSMPGGSNAAASTNSEVPEQEQLPEPLRAVGWLLVFSLIYLVATMFYGLGLGIYLASGMTGAGDGQPDPNVLVELIQTYMLSPSGLSGMYLVQFIVLVPTIIAASSFVDQSWRKTLAINPVQRKQLLFWAGMWVLYQVVFMILSFFVDVEVDEFINQIQGSKHIGMFLTVVVLAPIMEELLFRGYLFKAFRHSWLGFYGTLLITSVLFSSMHLGQYGWWGLSQVFVLALLLGVAREKTGSLYAPILIHVLNNLMAGILIIFLGMGG